MSTVRTALFMSAVGLWLGGAGAASASLPLLREAAAALQGGSEIRAWELVSQVPKAAPKDLLASSHDLAVWVADQYRLQRRFDDAIVLCNQIANAGDSVPAAVRGQAMLVKGNVYAAQQNFAAARLEYRSLAENNTYRETDAGRQARFLILDVMRRTGDHEAALGMIEHLRDLPDVETRAYALYQRAHIAFDSGNLEEAREFIELTKVAKPDLIENLFLEARLNLQQDRLQDPELEIGARVLSTYVIPGRPVSLRMHDRNLAVARGQSGIPIEVTTSPGNDREVLNLLASPRDATLFRATIATVLENATPGSNRLEVKGGDIVSYRIQEDFQRQNDLKYEAKQMMVVSDAELTASSGEWVTAAERDQQELQRQLQERLQAEGDTRQAFDRVRDTRVVRPGNRIYIQAIDYDRSVSPECDTVFVSVKAGSGGHVEGIGLTETGPHTGIFRGVLETTAALPQASASDSAAGHLPAAPLFSADKAIWSSVADSKQGKWYAVDLMASQPLKDVALKLDPGTVPTRVSVVAGFGNSAVEIASTHPADRAQYGYVDLASHFERQQPVQTAGYLYTEIDAGAGGPARLKIGSCDGVVAWVNGERVHNNQGGRIWKPEQDIVNVTLKSGINGIMLRVSQLTGPWGASLTVTDAQDKPLESLQPPSPVRPGVVTRWYLFDRLTSENIRVAERVNVEQPIRIRDEVFRWRPMDVTQPASITYADNTLRTTFNDSRGRRHLRWVFEAYKGDAIRIAEVSASNRFDDVVLPVRAENTPDRASRVLELGPGDDVQISYQDVRRVREDEFIFATMMASFHDATIGFFYDIIGADRLGERKVTYDQAYRFVAGETERLAVMVEDFDADVSLVPDKVRILVENSAGEKLWVDASETGNHAGMFIAILRLGATTGGDTIAVRPDGWVKASYADRESTDGELARVSRISDAPSVAPVLQQISIAVEHPVQVTDPSAALNAEKESATPRLKQVRPADPAPQSAPLSTSLETNLMFEVTSPRAALRKGSRLPVTLQVIRDGRPPVTVDMPLTAAGAGIFSVGIPLRIGSASAYTDLATRDEDAVPPLDVLGGDLVQVRIHAHDGTSQAEGWYRLASDAALRFTDRDYEEMATPLHVGDSLYLMVKDLDQDRGDDLDTITVMLEGSASRQELTLTETLPHSGVFTGRIKTRSAGGEVQPAASAPAAGNAAVTPDAGAAGEGAEPVLEASFGGTITATYMDKAGVLKTEPAAVSAAIRVFSGDDGQIVGFSKRFADDDVAVRTRLLTAEALFEMAKEYRTSGQQELAAEVLADGRTILQEAIIDYPHTRYAPHAEFLLANLAQELEDYQGALARYNRVLSAWPDSEYAPKSQLKKGIVLEAAGDPDSAMDAYVELTYSYPGSELVSDAVVRMGQHFYRIERFDLSGRVFSQFQARNPENPLAPRVLFLAAQSFLKGADTEAAKATGGRVSPKVSEYRDLAVSHFESLVKQYDDRDLAAESLYWLGDVYLKKADQREAYMSFRRLTFDYPESRWARFARGRLAENADSFSKVTEE